MQTPFPDELETPTGLVTKREILKLPPWAALTVATLVGAPWLFVAKLGWRAIGLAALGMGLAYLIGKAAKEDPDFLAAWLGEFFLEGWYE